VSGDKDQNLEGLKNRSSAWRSLWSNNSARAVERDIGRSKDGPAKQPRHQAAARSRDREEIKCTRLYRASFLLEALHSLHVSFARSWPWASGQCTLLDMDESLELHTYIPSRQGNYCAYWSSGGLCQPRDEVDLEWQVDDGKTPCILARSWIGRPMENTLKAWLPSAVVFTLHHRGFNI
jgi:hypothetical protein